MLGTVPESFLAAVPMAKDPLMGPIGILGRNFDWIFYECELFFGIGLAFLMPSHCLCPAGFALEAAWRHPQRAKLVDLSTAVIYIHISLCVCVLCICIYNANTNIYILIYIYIYLFMYVCVCLSVCACVKINVHITLCYIFPMPCLCNSVRHMGDSVGLFDSLSIPNQI